MKTRRPRPDPAPQNAPTWPDVVITLLHCDPRSQGARVIVTMNGRHVVSSASEEGMTVGDPNIQSFLRWARDYYEGAPVHEVTRADRETV
jgi:hypothetical protein